MWSRTHHVSDLGDLIVECLGTRLGGDIGLDAALSAGIPMIRRKCILQGRAERITCLKQDMPESEACGGACRLPSGHTSALRPPPSLTSQGARLGELWGPLRAQGGRLDLSAQGPAGGAPPTTFLARPWPP